MTWKLTAWAQTRAGVTGIEWRDYTDDEFAAIEELHPEIRQRGYFEHHDDEAAAEQLPEPPADEPTPEPVIEDRPRPFATRPAPTRRTTPQRAAEPAEED